MKRNIFRDFSTFSTFRRCIALLLTVFLLSDTVNQYVSVSAAEADIEATDEESYTEDENVITVEIGEDGTVTTDIDSLLTEDINNSDSEEDDLVEESAELGDSTESVDASGETEPIGSESSEDVENTDTENSESDTSEGTEAEIISFESTVGDVTITVSGDTETLADVSEISVTEMDENRVTEYNDILSEIEGYEKSEAIGVYDITLLNEDGEAMEPSGTVTVTFTSTALIEQLQERDELTVFHNVDTVLQEDEEITADEQELPKVKAESLEIIDTDITASEGTLVFETDAFSEYALVLTGNDTQVESEVDEDVYMEFDKYLVDTGGSINNQTTYDIYMENAYYNTNYPDLIDTVTHSPDRQDVMILVDHSNSISGANTIANANAGMLSFLTRVMEINQERIEKAKNGEYFDVDPGQTEAEIEAYMEDHLIYITGLFSFNRTAWVDYYDVNGTAPLTTGDVNKLYDYAEIILGSGAGASDGNIAQGTLAYLGLELVYSYLLKGTPARTNVMFLTDGLPNHSNSPANDAIKVAQKIKNTGATLWGIYERYGDLYDAQAAFASGDINDLPQYDDGAWFVGLCSSDSPSGGSGTIGGYNWKVNADPNNHFGTYTVLVDHWVNLATYLNQVANSINYTSSSDDETEYGYASSSSYFIEEVTEPFEITDTSSITVYQVPRIPANLDDDGIPISINDKGIVEDDEFRWGEQIVNTYDSEGEVISYSSEWEDITDQVNITVTGNAIKVTGYDYEANAVTNYDKDCVRYWPSLNTDEDKVYEAGDYGYKLVLVVGINAKNTFGGNTIATNNSNTTAFYPSSPQNSDLPEWTENTELNPEGNKYIEKYPVPTVDLNISYDVVSDNITIYAPQTAELLNLVTDTEGYLFYVDASYSTLKAENDNAYLEYQNALEAYNNANEAINNIQDGDDEDALMKEQQEAEDAYYEAWDVYLEANEALGEVANYTPNGINNAYVDIEFTLTDPNGVVVGALKIPHGTEYVTYDDGSASIEWEFTQDNISTSGIYEISCTITPVDTIKSPSGYVYVESDDDSVKTIYGYSSTEYSSTGSTASGSQTEQAYIANPSAYIFQLEITATDTRLEKGQTLDFNEGNEPLLTTENPHIISYRWVCTDGVTESNSADEPGITGLMKVGGGVTVTSQIPEDADAVDETVEDALVKIVSGTKVTNVDNGEWIPVSVILSRTTGNLNKSVSSTEQVTQTTSYMSDSDNLYGEGVSSVIWNHECDVITSYDCTEEDFATAQATYSTAEDGTGRGAVRYLIHVEENPLPQVSKTTDTETITMGDDIIWNVTVANSDATTNTYHNASDFSMVDVLPYVGDGRIDPDTNYEGSEFSGNLYYVSVTLDVSDSENTLNWLNSGKANLYYTTDESVRTADEQKALGNASSGNIEWTAVKFTIDGTKVTFSVPTEAVAIKFDTRLLWQETLKFTMTANIVNLSDQEVGDYYHNQAYVTTGNGVSNSEVVVTTVIDLYVQGSVWEDTDADGLMLDTEPGVSGIVVTLYKLYDENNGGTPDREIDGVKLTRAYDKDGDMFSPILTDSTGEYLFEGATSGTYYLVFDYISNNYNVTEKQAGDGDDSTSLIDSEAEEDFLIDQDELLVESAWIKEIVLSTAPAENMNLGLKNILGSITIGKTLDEIYYPTTMTEEEQADYEVMFEFQLKNLEDGTVYTDALKLDKDTYYALNGEPQVYVTFEDLSLGTYELTEMSTAYYEVSDVSSDSNNVSYDSVSMTATITLTSDDYDISVRVDNEFTELPPPGGDGNGVENWINMRIPVSLEIIYVGDNPISDETSTTYTFVESDFDPSKGGDIIVTYDDGTTISLSTGTLDFDDITLSPASVTSLMNSDDPVVITGYYSEKGRTLKDSYEVLVDLKPIHKFQLNFDANGSTFSNDSTRNAMRFGYDEDTESNFVTSGSYKDVDNGGLLSMGDGYVFAGWNTQDDGNGIQYDSYTSLNAIGADTSIDSLTLYANWKAYVTFDTNGGEISGGTLDSELAIVGDETGSILYNVNQVMATALTATKTNYTFVLWNTEPDGSGVDLEDYGKVTEPVTFYAIYYQSDYQYAGDVQTFTVPVDGVYEFQLWGSPGGYNGGAGGYTKFYIELSRGDVLYVFVGGSGTPQTGNVTAGGYNGGGTVWTCLAGAHAGTGGGMTHVSYTNNLAVAGSTAKTKGTWDPTGTIGVAGGGGGGPAGTTRAYGGGEVAGIGYLSRGSASYSTKAATTDLDTGEGTGYQQGCGQASANSSAGGGGWYGGYSNGMTKQYNGGYCGGSGGGGTGYICEAGQLTQYTYLNQCLSGNSSNIPAKPNAGTSLSQHGYVQVVLYEQY